MQRITEKQLQILVDTINEKTKSPMTSYTKNKQGKFSANIGNFHLYQAYGSIGLHRMMNTSGGVDCVIDLCTKRELYHRLHAMITGLSYGK